VIAFRPFYPLSETDCQRLAKWANDPFSRHLFNHFPNEEAYGIQTTAQEIGERSLKEEGAPGFQRWMILRDGEPIGEMSFGIDAPQLLTKLPGTAWLGIVIGEAAARRHGIGTEAMHYLEHAAQQVGATRIELGVFEYNTSAIQFYRKLNYRQIAVIPEFAHWNGRLWSDIRMLKELTLSSARADTA
jgi:RimJ/RimL family protein N-acetyltransferase